MKRFFSLKELCGALVVDSEALIYGYIGGWRFTSAGLELEVRIKVKARDVIPDTDKLSTELARRGVKEAPSLPVELLIARAREEGLDIPWKEAERSFELTKAYVPVNEVALIDSTIIEHEGSRKTVTVVLLKTPREARYRGLPVQESVPPPSPGLVEGKLVVSLEKGIIGIAREIVVGPGEAGIRVSKASAEKGYIAWLAFLTSLKKKGYTSLYEALAKRYDPYTYARLQLAQLPSIKSVLEELGAPREAYEILEKSIAVEKPAEHVDVAWSSIVKVRDVVLVR